MNSIRTIYSVISALATSVTLVGTAVAQGTVNVNNRGLAQPQLVMFNDDYPGLGPRGPVVGTQYVAQIVYGPSSIPLGAPMAFRIPTTTSPGTWNPGTEGIRTLNGFTEGQVVSLTVRVWDTTPFPGISGTQTTWEDVRALASGHGGALPQGYQWGTSASFNYVVGSAANPVSLVMANFQGFELTTYYMPEPNVIALAVLGGVGLIWLVRRR